MSKQSDAASIKDVYELVERTRIEMKQDMLNAVAVISNNQGSLEKKFDDLEAGRLTRAEEHIRRLQVTSATFGTKMAVLAAIGVVVLSAAASIITEKVMK